MELSWFRTAVHNCVIHPLWLILPQKVFDAIHDRNARWAFPAKDFK